MKWGKIVFFFLSGRLQSHENCDEDRQPAEALRGLSKKNSDEPKKWLRRNGRNTDGIIQEGGNPGDPGRGVYRRYRAEAGQPAQVGGRSAEGRARQAKSDATKWKTEADKLPDVQKELDGLKTGKDWKAEFDKEHQAFEDYKSQIARDAETAKVKAAYKKLLTEEKISEKTLESVLNATDYSKMKLKDDGTLDGIEDLKKDIDTKWGGFKVSQRQRGEKVDNPPPGGSGGSDNSTRDMMAKLHAARYGAAPAKQ